MSNSFSARAILSRCSLKRLRQSASALASCSAEVGVFEEEPATGVADSFVVEESPAAGVTGGAGWGRTDIVVGIDFFGLGRGLLGFASAAGGVSDGVAGLLRVVLLARS